MRYTNLDFLRGLCLLIMTIDHFGDLGIVRIFGFFTAAEGFVFISGIVSGIVYYRRFLKSSLVELRHSAFARALKIYKYHLICALCLVLIAVFADGFFKNYYMDRAPFFIENPVLAGFLNALFLYKTYHLDILPMYVIFLLLIPGFVSLSEKITIRRTLSISAILWAVNLLSLTAFVYGWLNGFMPVNMGGFNVLAWQFLFFIGFGFGMRHVKNGYSFNFQSKTGLWLSILVMIICFIVKWFGVFEAMPFIVEQALIGKQTLGAIKLANFLACCYITGYLVTKYRLFQKPGFLSVIGKHSLYVFTFHIIILYLFIPFYQEYIVYGLLKDLTTNKILWKSITLGLTIPLSLIIYFPAWYREQINAKLRKAADMSRG